MAARQHISPEIDPSPEGIRKWVRTAATILNARIDDAVNIGQMRVFFGDIEADWLACDGTDVSRTTYSGLFDKIGTTYGEGDGVTTFTLPNMQAFVIDNSGEETVSLDNVESISPVIAIRTE